MFLTVSICRMVFLPSLNLVFGNTSTVVSIHSSVQILTNLRVWSMLHQGQHSLYDLESFLGGSAGNAELGRISSGTE